MSGAADRRKARRATKAALKRAARDASKARQTLGWKPKMGFEELVSLMVREDLRKLKSETQ